MKTMTRKFIFGIAILAVAGISGIQSCKKKSDSTPVVNNVSVTGIFHGDTVWINDTIPAMITFSLDELSDGTLASGGIYLRMLRHSDYFNKHLYVAKHTLGNWQENSDGTTQVEGTCDLGTDIGSVSFSGTITKNLSFVYKVVSSKFTGTGTARWSGEFVRPNGGKATKSTTVYTGWYRVICWGHISWCYGNYIGDFGPNLTITSQWPDGYGGTALGGYFTGNLPYWGNNQYNLNSENEQSVVYGGDLILGVINDIFGYSLHNWNPYGYNYGVQSYWCLLYDLGYQCGVSGDVEMDAQSK